MESRSNNNDNSNINSSKENQVNESLMQERKVKQDAEGNIEVTISGSPEEMEIYLYGFTDNNENNSNTEEINAAETTSEKSEDKEEVSYEKIFAIIFELINVTYQLAYIEAVKKDLERHIKEDKCSEEAHLIDKLQLSLDKSVLTFKNIDLISKLKSNPHVFFLPLRNANNDRNLAAENEMKSENVEQQNTSPGKR